MKTVDTHNEFEVMAREFLAEQPTIRHEWEKISGIRDSRTDLICEPGTNKEVFATLRNWQIAIGTKTEHTDFEDFGRDLTEKEVAVEAFARFVTILKMNGVLSGGE